MSQLPLTSAERTASLMSLGYTEREAAFLSLVALHSGYFLRRQYVEAAGIKIGGTAALLVAKLLAYKHSAVLVFAYQTKVYHLGARPFYAGLGQEDNRNRRTRQPQAIKKKLMILDFVIEHSSHRFLATEQEKVDCFTSECGIAREELPAKLYQSPTTGATTTRYFVDKQPIFIRAAQGARAVVSFAYIDDGALTCSGFNTWLKQYELLFDALPEVEIVYVATSDARFRMAEQMLHVFETGPGYEPKAADTPRLVRHFEDRAQVERKDLTGFDRTRLLRFRDEREIFGTEAYEALYRLWKEEGPRAVAQKLGGDHAGKRFGRFHFSTWRLDQSYAFLGNFDRSADTRRTHLPRQERCSDVSARVSAGLSETTS